MKETMRKFGAWLLAAALAFAGAGAVQAETKQVATQEALNAAVSAANAGDVIEITAAGTYKVPSPTSAIKIVGVDGVVFNAIDAQYGESVGQATGTEFENVKFAFSNSLYTGFQHSSYVAFTKCSFTGRFDSYGEMHFTECSFEAPGSEYSMWLYAGDTYFKDCTFSGAGKFFNVYNEGNTDVPWIVEFDGCTFSSSTSNKAALNVKSTCGAKGLKYDVTVNNCKIDPNGNNFPSASTSDSLIVFNGLIQLDDIQASVPNEITIKQDGVTLYANNAVVETKPEVEVVVPTVSEEKGITQEIVDQIAANPEVAKVEDTGLKAALAEDGTLKDAEAVVKVELKEAAKDTSGVLTYEIKPVVKGETDTDISDKVVGKPITFRVPLTDAFSDVAKVTHKGKVDEISHVKVLGDAGSRYVELTFVHFSEVDFAPENWLDTTPVKIGDTFYASLGEAIKAGVADAEILCKPGATIPVGSNVHEPFLKSTTIYGNGAVLASSSEYSLQSLPADGSTYSIKIFDLGKVGLWDAVKAGVKIDILVEDCQDVHEVQIQGGNAESVVNTVVRNCTFDMVNGCAHMSGVSQDCGGSVLVEGCSFNGLLCGVNVKNDVGALTTTVKDCTFVDCGLVGNKYNKSDASGDNTNLGAPIRVGSKAGATNAAIVKDNAISYADGAEKILEGDVIIGDNRPGKDAAGEVMYDISGTAAKVDVYPTHGKLSGDDATAFTKDAEKSVVLTATESAEGKNESKPVVAKIGTTKYPTLQAAFAAAGTAKNVTIELLSDVDLKDVDWPSIDFNGTFDGKGYTISNLKVAYSGSHSGFIRYSDNGAVVKNVTFKDSEITGNRASVVIGYGYGCTAENVTVAGAVITGVQKCGGIVALVGEDSPLTVTGCAVNDLQFKYAEEGKNEGSSFGGLVGYVNYGVDAVITGNKVSGISYVGAVDQATLEAWAADTGFSLEKCYQWTCHPFIAAVMGTQKNNATTPISVTLANNEVEQVEGLLKGPMTTTFIGFFYREGTPGVAADQHVVDITVDGVLMPNRAVAQIGETKYPSIAAAVAAVPTDGTLTTIKMIADEAFAGADGKVAIASTKNVVLDLNGFTLSYTTEGYGAFISNNGTLEITDTSVKKLGKITAQFANPNWMNGCYTVDNGNDTSGKASAKLIITAGTIENTSDAGLAWPVNNGSWGSNAETTINGGTIHSVNYVPVRQYLHYAGSKKLVINGGTFVSDNSRAVAVQFNDASVQEGEASVIINGGDFSCNGSGILYMDLHAANLNTTGLHYEVNGGKFKNANKDAPVVVYDNEGNVQDSAVLVTKFIKGGIFSAKPADDTIAEGYEVQANVEPLTKDDYLHAVAKKAFVPLDDNPITIDITPAGGTQAIVPVTVSEDAVTAMVNAGIVMPAGEKATAAEVSEGLAKKQDNQQTVWQNYVMGVDGTNEKNVLATIGEKSADKPKEVVVVKTPIAEFKPPQNTGVTVTYNLLRKRPGETQFSVYQKGLRKPEFDVNTIELELGDTLWKFEAVFSAEKSK